MPEVMISYRVMAWDADGCCFLPAERVLRVPVNRLPLCQSEARAVIAAQMSIVDQPMSIVGHPETGRYPEGLDLYSWQNRECAKQGLPPKWRETAERPVYLWAK